MHKFLTVIDGHEDGVNLMIEIGPGMEKELQITMDEMSESNTPIEINYGTMTDAEYEENNIKSVMYAECCERDEALEIIKDIAKG